MATITAETDYSPYGGEFVITSGDSNHYKFTGKERDTESGLDNFLARYHSSSLGRFMTPDWAAKPTSVPYATFGDPQSLNLYSYVENGPLNRVDADGHEDISTIHYQAGGACGDQVLAWFMNMLGTKYLGFAAGEARYLTQLNSDATQTMTSAQNTYKSKDAAAEAAGREMRKKENGYKQEYGARIHKDGKKYSYGPVVTDKDRKGVNLPDIQKNDVGDIHMTCTQLSFT